MKKRTFLLIISFCLSILFLTACGKEVIFDGGGNTLPTTPPKGQNEQSSSTNFVTEALKKPTESATKETLSPTPTGKPMPTETTEPTKQPTPTPTKAPTPTETPQKSLTVTEATELLKNRIGSGYKLEQAGSVMVDNAAYFLFNISDETHSYRPQVAVEANSRTIVYFYSVDEIMEFTTFPPDNAEVVVTEQEGEGGFTQDKAIILLKEMDPETLNLPVALSEYTIMVDEWTTMIYGNECFGINAYADLGERMQLMGVFYVAVDGSCAFRSEMGDFEKIK